MQVDDCNPRKLTAHVPAALATMPLLIIIGLTPLVLLKIAPLNAPATILFVASSVGQLCQFWILLLCFSTMLSDGLALTLSARISNIAVYSVVHHRNHTGRIA
jgi:hypothetical protein